MLCLPNTNRNHVGRAGDDYENDSCGSNWSSDEENGSTVPLPLPRRRLCRFSRSPLLFCFFHSSPLLPQHRLHPSQVSLRVFRYICLSLSNFRFLINIIVFNRLEELPLNEIDDVYLLDFVGFPDFVKQLSAKVDRSVSPFHLLFTSHLLTATFCFLNFTKYALCKFGSCFRLFLES